MYGLMEILFCAIDVIFLDRFVRLFLEQKPLRKKYYKFVLMMLLSLMIHVVTGFKVFSGHTTIISLMLMCLYTTGLYKGSVQNKLIITTFFEVLLGLTTMISLNLLAFLSGKEIAVLLSYGNMKRVVSVVIVKVIVFIVLTFIKKIFSSEKVEMPAGYRYLVLAIFLISFITVMLMFNLSVFNKETVGYQMLIIVAIIFLAFNVIIYSLFREIIINLQEKAKTNLIIHNQEVINEHIIELNKTHKEIRKIKHDILNHYGILEYLIRNGNMDESLKYIQELRARADSIPIYYSTGNMIGDVVINQKIYATREENIKYDLKVCFPDESKITDVDLGTLLVNILDNAIDAVREVDAGKRKIGINIHPHHNKLLLNITNTVANNPIQGNKLIRREKANKHEHGYGLLNIKYVVKKYDGFMEYSCKDNIFEINILLDYI